MQAAGLLEERLLVSRQCRAVAGHGVSGEEPEGVEVGAPQVVALDHLVGPRLSEAQRHGVAVLVGTVDHRPFVQPEAAELARPGGGAAQHPLDEAGEV